MTSPTPLTKRWHKMPDGWADHAVLRSIAVETAVAAGRPERRGAVLGLYARLWSTAASQRGEHDRFGAFATTAEALRADIGLPLETLQRVLELFHECGIVTRTSLPGSPIFRGFIAELSRISGEMSATDRRDLADISASTAEMSADSAGESHQERAEADRNPDDSSNPARACAHERADAAAAEDLEDLIDRISSEANYALDDHRAMNHLWRIVDNLEAVLGRPPTPEQELEGVWDPLAAALELYPTEHVAILLRDAAAAGATRFPDVGTTLDGQTIESPTKETTNV